VSLAICLAWCHSAKAGNTVRDVRPHKAAAPAFVRMTSWVGRAAAWHTTRRHPEQVSYPAPAGFLNGE